MFGKICATGVPSFLAELSTAVVVLILNNLLKNLGSTVAIASFGVVLNIYFVTSAIFNGIAQGAQPLFSVNYGKNDKSAVKKVLLYSVLTAVAFAIIIYLVLFFCADGITSIFNSKNNPTLQSLAPLGIKLFFISVFFSSINVVFTTYFSATNHTILSQILTIVRGYITTIPCAFLLAHLFKINGIWLTYPIAEGITLLVTICMFLAMLIRSRKQSATLRDDGNATTQSAADEQS